MRPVTVITGFLGSGKSTLLNELLHDPRMADAAVIINEFGEIPIDHLLVESAIENLLVLENGCVCCTIRGDLVDTLTDLQGKAQRNEIPAFTRVVIETTGMADVAPIMQTLLFDRMVTADFELTGVVATVDGVNGRAQLGEFTEAVRQAALADVIIVTKGDLIEAAAVAELEDELRKLNPTARILRAVNGQIDAEFLFRKVGNLRAGETDIHEWLEAESSREEDHDHGEHHAESRHGSGILTFTITRDQPVTRETFKAWLQSITSLRGSDLLRVKGVVNIEGMAGPVLVQGVQHVLHPPRRLAAWPDADHRTRLVFITRGIPKTALVKSLEAAAN